MEISEWPGRRPHHNLKANPAIRCNDWLGIRTMKKAYLGDGVYADWDGGRVILTTDNGIEATNTIIMEPEVLVALERYMVRLQAHCATERKDS